jgi:cytochrome b561
VQDVDLGATGYDRTTITLHWLTALLVVAQWCVAKMIDWAPRGDLRVPMRSLHLTVGVVLVALIAVRIVWRATRGRRLPAADRGPLYLVAKATHWGLYALIVAALLLGLLLWWIRGDTWFFVFSPPKLEPTNTALRRFVSDWHPTLATAILWLAGLHAAAALCHRIVWRDGVLGRMLVRTTR